MVEEKGAEWEDRARDDAGGAASVQGDALGLPILVLLGLVVMVAESWLGYRLLGSSGRGAEKSSKPVTAGLLLTRLRVPILLRQNGGALEGRVGR